MKRIGIALLNLLFLVPVVSAGTISSFAEWGQLLKQRVPLQQQSLLSSSGQALIHMNDDRGDAEDAGEFGKQNLPQFGILAPASNPNLPSEIASRMSGFTQNQPAIAWCGNNAVTVYNDTGSWLEVIQKTHTNDLSLAGISRSTDQGVTFTDEGYLTPLPHPGYGLYGVAGTSSIVCTNPDHFFIASVAGGVDLSYQFTSDIVLQRSVDAGATFSGPIVAVSKDGFQHFLDKPSLGYDPNNEHTLYIAYTDIDYSASVCPDYRTAIELVKSMDGGHSWSTPVVIQELCSRDQVVQNSNVLVDNQSRVHVGWEYFDTVAGTAEMDIARSTDGGDSFGPAQKINNVSYVGFPARPGLYLLQGILQVPFDGPALAIDRSGGPFNGRIYACWQDGRNFSSADPFFNVIYHFSDVLCSSSANGMDWSSPVRANDNTKMQATDQYQPSVAVDTTGAVGVLFYDRRTDKRNFLINATLAVSTDGGKTFSNKVVGGKSWPPAHTADILGGTESMGDWLGVAGDSQKVHAGFVGVYTETTRGEMNVSATKQ